MGDRSGSLVEIVCLQINSGVEVIPNPTIMPDVDSGCLATQADIGLLQAQHRASTKGSEAAQLRSNLKEV